MLKTSKRNNILISLLFFLLIFVILSIYLKTTIQTLKEMKNQKIINYFYNLEIKDKKIKDIYLRVKYGYTTDNLLKQESTVYFNDLEIILKNQYIKINKGYYKNNIIYVNPPLEIKNQNTTITIKKDIYIQMDKLILVGKEVYISNPKSITTAKKIIINLLTLNYELYNSLGKVYK